MDLNRTCGWDLLISDGNIPEGYILEQTANVSYVCNWDDPVESTGPFWMIEDVLRRTNCFIVPECAELQRGRYNPSGFRGLLRLILQIDEYFREWTHYKALSRGYEKNWGYLDLNITMDMFRDVYLGKTSFIFKILMYYVPLFSPCYQPLNQWVACPETGEMVISFASVNKMAHFNPVHYFNFFELLESEPPS
jgi:hypothetical protein